MNKILTTFILLISVSCNHSGVNKSSNLQDYPSWYVSPKPNNQNFLYGVAEGNTMEEATRYALADVAAKLMVSISSESELIRQENKNSFNEELRQRARQSIEKISFTNYKVSRSQKNGEKFYIEIEIERIPFIRDQKERVVFLEKKILDLDKNSKKSNIIQRRVDLIKILDLCKELELKSRILNGAREESNLKEKLELIANYQNELEKSSSKIEFFIDDSSSKNVLKIIRNALNKENFKVASKVNEKDPNQIVLKIKFSSKYNFIYEAHISKIEVEFKNLSEGKIIASNSVEVSGSSTISESESIDSALKSLEEKIQQDGILKTIGIIS